MFIQSYLHKFRPFFSLCPEINAQQTLQISKNAVNKSDNSKWMVKMEYTNTNTNQTSKKNAIAQQTQHVIEISVCPATFSCPPAFRAHSIFPVEISPGVPKNMIRWLTITTVIPMHLPNNEIIMQYAIFMLVFNLFKNQSCVSSFHTDLTKKIRAELFRMSWFPSFCVHSLLKSYVSCGCWCLRCTKLMVWIINASPKLSDA